MLKLTVWIRIVGCFCRFRVSSDDSTAGRTGTTPSPKTMPERLWFAFASCQHFVDGCFTADKHMTNEDHNLVAHLGDYIYEYSGRESKTRMYIGSEIHTLKDYRNRYAQYRTDLELQSTHALYPWLLMWDDHEFDNNYATQLFLE